MSPNRIGDGGLDRSINGLRRRCLLSFRLRDNRVMEDAAARQMLRRLTKSADQILQAGAIIASARRAFAPFPARLCGAAASSAKGAVLMPSFVNIGAYVGEGTMVDTWATVGSCAQIGKNVHLSGGAGIGGVLEPLQAEPVIIGDGAFIGARSGSGRGRARR